MLAATTFIYINMCIHTTFNHSTVLDLRREGHISVCRLCRGKVSSASTYGSVQLHGFRAGRLDVHVCMCVGGGMGSRNREGSVFARADIGMKID